MATKLDELHGVPDGWRVSIYQDDDADSPRDMCDDAVHVLTVPSREYIDVDKDPGPWGAQWRELLSRYGWEPAIEIVTRWARIHGHHVYENAPVRGTRSLWYLTREDAEREGWADPGAVLKAYADEYNAWAEGEVYGWVIEAERTWQRVDGPDAGQREERWEHVESVWGYYGPGTEYVEQEAREALTALIEAEGTP